MMTSAGPTWCDVLLRDDDVLVLGAIAENLREFGYVVAEANNSPDALAKVGEDEHPRILVTDINTEEVIDGRDVAQQSLKASPGLLVVYIAGRPDGFEEPRSETISGSFRSRSGPQSFF